MPEHIPYKSFCWCLGTTSFRTKDFNRTIELQLSLLHDFRHTGVRAAEEWSGNAELQTAYYEFMKARGFLDGDANNRAKDAREKTSGLVDIGLIDAERRLTGAGEALLAVSRANDFAPDNFFQIPKDSFLYLKQLLKTSCAVDGETVRPLIVLLYVLSRVERLSAEEFTYLLPLCTNAAYTEEIVDGIFALRNGAATVDGIILRRLMEMDNYRHALAWFLESDVTVELLCEVGLNRKSRQYDKAYYPLYQSLYAFYVDGDAGALLRVFRATRGVKLGKWWRAYLFSTGSEARIARRPAACLRPTLFDGADSEAAFKLAFFRVMHLFKAKSTLADYDDLNRRYLKTADVLLFEDDGVRLDIVPKHFFGGVIGELYASAYTSSDRLGDDCALEAIAPCLVIDVRAVIDGVNAELGVAAATIEQARQALDDRRYARLRQLIDAKFTDAALLALLDSFANRDDGEIRAAVTDNADVPTIFEYVLGILWYKASGYEGRILDYMKLSLDANLLPKTHAAGGEADIVYEYAACEAYPAHSLLLEATLADGTNQRRMEMEPVSRHLGQHLLRTGNAASYCVFAVNELNINVLSDFRARKNTFFYDTQDTARYVTGMKIVPLQISELKKIVAHRKPYRELYPIFEASYRSALPPHEWYGPMLAEKL